MRKTSIVGRAIRDVHCRVLARANSLSCRGSSALGGAIVIRALGVMDSLLKDRKLCSIWGIDGREVRCVKYGGLKQPWFSRGCRRWLGRRGR